MTTIDNYPNLTMELERKGLVRTVSEGDIRLKRENSREVKGQPEIKENIIVGNLKYFLNINHPEILSGHYIRLNGVAKSFYKQGWDLYNKVLQEGYSLDKHLSEKERESLLLFVTQASQEYLPYLEKKKTEK